MTPLPPPEPITDEFLITKQFRTADEFSLFIEKSAVASGMKCLDRMLEYCEEMDIDTEAVAVLVNSSLKGKIQAEAEALNLLKKSSGQLSFQ